MTPRQFYALRKRQFEHLQREEVMVGILASTTANFSFCRPEKPLSAEDFMLHPPTKTVIERPTDAPGDTLSSLFHKLPPAFLKQKP